MVAKVRRCRSPQEKRAFAEALAREHGGKLPCSHQIRSAGFGWLAEDIRKYPARYEGLLPENPRRCRTPGEHLLAAEQLAKAHDGWLPSPGWLQKNGFAWLDLDMKSHPELYSRIRQRHQINRRPKSRVPAAPVLADRPPPQPETSGNCLLRIWKRLRGSE